MSLYVGCPGLQLPSLLPDALVAETALRFTHVQYRTTTSVADVLPKDKHARDVVRLSISNVDPEFHSWSNTSVVPIFAAGQGLKVGANEIVEAASNYNSGSRHVGLDNGLTSGQLATSTAVSALIRSTIFPAFEYALYADDATFEMVRAAHHSSLSAWDRLFNPVPARRKAKLAQLGLTHPWRSVTAAIDAARQGLTALERLLAHHTNHVSMTDEWNSFFLGTASPTSIDAVVFAAVTLAASSRFHAANPWSKFQLDSGLTLDVVSGEQEFPRLCQYGRMVAKRYYEQYAGLHYLNLPMVRATMDDTTALLYTSGRKTTLFITGVFALVYMIVANAQLILESLESKADEEREEEEAERAEAAAAHTHGVQQEEVPPSTAA